MNLAARVLTLAIIAGTLLASAVGTPASAAGAPASTTAFDAIGGCFASQKHVLLALVMDESASLGDIAKGRPGTDPTARRVAAAQVAIDGISNLASQGTKVDLLVTGFSDDLHVYGRWQPLDPASRAGIERQLEGFRTRDEGLDTDFYNAMNGVQREFTREAAALGSTAQPCELVLLFTDGRFDIDSRTPKPYDPRVNDTKALKAALGTQALCNPGGPMQRLRDDGGRTITLTLSDPSAGPGQADPAFLQRLATGDCNKPGNQYGASFDASNAGQLVSQFDAVATRLRGGTALAADCARPQSLAVVPALAGIHVFADAGSPPSDLVITPPGAAAIHISAANGNVPPTDGVSLRVAATGNRFLTVDAAPASGATTASPRWSGPWSVAFTKPTATSRCSISVFETWKPQAQNVVLQRGINTPVSFSFVAPDGSPTPTSAFPANATVSATLSNGTPSATPTPIPVKRVGPKYQADINLPASFSGQTAIVTATLHLRLAGTDVTSSPGVTTLRVRESGFPALAPPTLRMSTVSGKGIARGTVLIVGDKAYAGVVCLDRVEYPTPPPISPAQLVATRSGTCTNVGAGGVARFVFAVDVRAVSDGRVNGQLDLTLTGIGGRKLASTLPFTFTITRQVSTTTRNTYFFVLLLVGIAAPMLFLLYLGYRTAVFHHPAGLRAARMRVRVFADGRMRRIDASGASPPFSLEEHDFVDAEIKPGRARSFKWHDLSFRARWSWNPFADPRGEVGVKGQYVTASEGVTSGRRGVTRGEVPLTLPGTWVFALDPEPDVVDEQVRAVDGTVSIFIAAGAPFTDQAPRVMRSFTEFFADLAQSLDHGTGRATEPARR